MSLRHLLAVQLHSKIQDDETRHILEIIAADIGDDDSPSRLSNRKIAQRARCAVNTTRKRLDDILKTKEVLADCTGNSFCYRLNAELVPYNSPDVQREAREDGGIADGVSPVAFEVIKEVVYQASREALIHSEERLYQLENLIQQLVSTVSSLQRSVDTTASNTPAVSGHQRCVDTTVSSIQRGVDTRGVGGPLNPTSLTRPYTNKDNIYIYTDPDDLETQELIGRYKTALSLASKTPYALGFNEDKYDAAARLCIEKGVSLAVIESFPSYWRDMGWGGSSGKPTLDVVLAELDNCANRVDTRKKQKNGIASGKTTAANDHSGGYYG